MTYRDISSHIVTCNVTQCQVKQGEQLLASLQAALSNIHTAQLEMQKIAADEFIEAYTGANTL